MRIFFAGAARTVTGSQHLLEFVTRCRGNRRKIFVIHGEESQSLALAKRLTELGIPEVQVPMQGEFVRV